MWKTLKALGSAAKICHHIFLVGLHTGLIEGIHTQGVCADAAGELEEVHEVAQGAGIHAAALQYDDGNAAVHMGGDNALIGVLLHIAHGLAGEVVEVINVFPVQLNADVMGIRGKTF